MDFYLLLELLSVIFGLIYLVLLIKQNILCWLFGIVGSVLSIFLFYHSKLYSEALLYSYYVVMGFYGYYLWSQKNNDYPNESISLTVSDKGLFFHVFCVITTSVLALALVWFFDSYTDADWPYLDAFTTMFSFLATYLEAKKVLSGWVYWIVINGLTIGLYYNKDLDYYSALTLIYFIMSFVGYFKWKKELAIAG